MEFEIVSYSGAGPIVFGMTREIVRQRIEAPAESFMKSPNSAAPADAFDSLGLHVHYDADERCEAIEFHGSMASPTFRNQQLLGQPFATIERWLRAIDPDLQTDSTGLTSLLFGLGLYAPSVTYDPHSPVEGVIVFRRGYYDNARDET